MKKSFILTLVLLLALSGCAKTQPETTTAPSTEPVTSASTTAPTTVPTTAPTTVPTTEPVTEPTEPELEVPAGATELSAEEIDFFADLLEQEASFEGFPGNNWYNLALGCVFETPAEIDFYQLFRQGNGDSVKSEYELAYLQTDPFISLDMDNSSVSTAEMEDVFQTYFGCSMEDTEKRGLDEFLYYPATDRYYRISSGNKYVWDFTVRTGYTLSNGNILLYIDVPYTGIYAYTLRPVSEGYHIVSNRLYFDRERHEEPVPEPAAPEGGVPLTAEELAEFDTLFTQPRNTGRCEPTNWYNVALNQRFSEPSQLDWISLFGEGARGEDVPYNLTEAEEEFLKTRPDVTMYDGLVYLSRETVEDVLANYFGLTIPEAEQYGLNKTLAYFPDTDRYYCPACGGLTKHVAFAAGYTLPNGDILLYRAASGSWKATTLRPTDTGYIVIANNFVETP